MLEFLKESFNDKTFNLYTIILGNDNISDDLDNYVFHTNLSSPIIKDIKFKLSKYPAICYDCHTYAHNNTYMELKKDVEIYRNVVIDSLFDVTSFPIKMLICKCNKNDVPRNQFPSNLNYYETKTNIFKYTVSENINVYIIDNKKIKFEIKKDEYIDSVTDELEKLLKYLITDNSDN